MKRPLVTVALCYLSGVLLANGWSVEVGWLFVFAFVTGLLALLMEKTRPWFLMGFLVLLGWTNLTARTSIISSQDLRALIEERDTYLTARGALVMTPTQRVFVRDEHESWRTHTVLQIESLRRGEAWEPAYGQIAVLTPGVLSPDFFTDQIVEVTGVLRVPKGPVAEGLFDYRTYLRWQGIHYQLHVRDTNAWRIIIDPNSPKTPPLADRFFVWAQRVLARDLPVEDESLQLLWAMTLGWQTALTTEVSEPFMRSGTMHIFAISGLHIALIAGIFVALLRVLRMPRSAVGILAIPLIWFYTAATGWQPSAIRSTIMMTIIIAGWALKRPSDLLNSLAASGFIILLWQPEQLFQASFQLSFFVVLSIALLMPPFEQLRQRLLQNDPFLPDELRPRWRQWLDGVVYFVTGSFATSLAAWFGSLPLIAYYFHLFTPGSLLANLLVVPVSSAALACNLGSIFCGDWLPSIGALFNHSAWLWMFLMVRLSEWATTLPASYVYVREPTAWEFVLYYALIFLAVSGCLFGVERRRWTIPIVALLALAWTWPSGRNETQITVFNGANAIFVKAPKRTNRVLLDCGSDSAADFIVKPYLRGQGVNRLPKLLLTHGDTRHIGGTARMEKEFAVEQIVTSSVTSRSQKYREIVAQLACSPEHWQQVNRDDTLGEWHVLHPSASDHFPQADDNALVLRADVQGIRVLLLSDAGRLAQRTLLDHVPEMRADIVVAGLPTQAEPLSAALLAGIRPRLIVVQDQEFPASARAGRKLRERLKQSNIPVLYTTDAGTVTLHFSTRGCAVNTMNGQAVFLPVTPLD